MSYKYQLPTEENNAGGRNKEPLDKEMSIRAVNLACQEGWVPELKKELIKEELFVAQNPSNPYKKAALHEAAENGNLDQVPREFLSIKNITKKDSLGYTPLFLASKHHPIETIPQEILERLSPKTLLEKNKDGISILENFLNQQTPDSPVNKYSYKTEKNKNDIILSPEQKEEIKRKVLMSLLNKITQKDLVTFNKETNSKFPMIREVINNKAIKEMIAQDYKDPILL
jgi:hypothetical protein